MLLLREGGVRRETWVPPFHPPSDCVCLAGLVSHSFLFISFLNPRAVNTYYVLGTALDLKCAGRTKTRSLSSESSIPPLSPVGGFISTPPFPMVGPQGMPAG